MGFQAGFQNVEGSERPHPVMTQHWVPVQAPSLLKRKHGADIEEKPPHDSQKSSVLLSGAHPPEEIWARNPFGCSHIRPLLRREAEPVMKFNNSKLTF